jgi:glycosyltransferase involved in cell wall biosynthesis
MPQRGAIVRGRALRVVIDARLVTGQSGGLEGVVAGLAHGLSQLDGPDEYLFAVWPGHDGWLKPFASGPASLATVDFDPPYGRYGLASKLTDAELFVRRLTGKPPRRDDQDSRVPSRDPWIEALEPSVVHMLRQRGFLASVPSIYHPHDLQHVHLPEFFTARQIAWRERVYGRLCRESTMVAVASEWTRRDVMDHYGLQEDAVRVVTLAPPMGAAPSPTAEDRLAIRARHGLPDEYVLYPAQTWPHKNHSRLLEALAKLREDGVVVPLVATGMKNDHFEQLAGLTERLGLVGHVTWTGFVSPVELRAIYAEARAVVIPSLFEAASAPLWEAFLADVPAACSNVTALPDQAGDAAVVFDPLDVGAIAKAIAQVWSDDELRARLVRAGRERLAPLSWRRTAEAFRAHYRRLAGEPLAESDLVLIGAAT